jgi:hypothetical protein
LLSASDTILPHKLKKKAFMLFPILDWVTIRTKEAAEDDPIAEFGAETQSCSETLYLFKKDFLQSSLPLFVDLDLFDLFYCFN